MKKKLMMILLSVVMVVSMLPATAFAGEGIHAPQTGDYATATGDAFVVQGTGAEASVALTWTKAEKASKYKVYYKKATAKKYKLAKTTKAQKLTLKKLSKNTYYKVFVRAINKKGKKVAQTAAIKVATGNAIKFQYAGDTPLVVYDGVIPYDSWAKAVAKGWTFTANVAGNAVQAKLVEYSDNRVGVEALDGTKLGVFYNEKPRYEYNMVKLEDMVDAGHTYFVGDVWPVPAPVVEATEKTITIEYNEYYQGSWLYYQKTVAMNYDTWAEAYDAGWSYNIVVLKSDIQEKKAAPVSMKEAEQISTLQAEHFTGYEYKCTLEKEETGDIRMILTRVKGLNREGVWGDIPLDYQYSYRTNIYTDASHTNKVYYDRNNEITAGNTYYVVRMVS